MAGSRDAAARWLNALWYGQNPMRWLLWPVALLFRALVALRRLLYAQGLRRAQRVGAPVIVIGNLTVGGTGKTPLTIWLARELGARGRRVGIVCRGYGGRATVWPQRVGPQATAAQVGDEARLLANRTGCPVAAGPDRVAAARMLLAAGEADLILVDDGLQHYRLQRDFEIAVVDGARGFGNGLCLPAGPLREPVSRLRDVDAVVVNGEGFDLAGALRMRVRADSAIELASGTARRLDAFAGQRVHAVAAIGNPERFFATLRTAGLLVEAHAHADHLRLSAEQLRFDDGLPVIMTEKDAVKCEGLAAGNVWYVVADVDLAAGAGERLLRDIGARLEGFRPEQ